MLRALSWITPNRERDPDTRLSGVDPTNHPKERGTHVTPDEVEVIQEKRQQLYISSTPGRMKRGRGDRMPYSQKKIKID